MFPATPKIVARGAVWRPLLDLLDGHYLTAAELAARWRYTEDHLSNMRRAGKGPPWTKFGNGGIRYRAADVIEAELSGMQGGLTLDKVLLAVSACTSVPDTSRVEVIEHLREVFGRGAKPAAGTA